MDLSGSDLIQWAVSVLGLSGDAVRATPLSRGGSDRIFFRLAWDGGSVFLMHYGSDRRENACYVPIARFLREIGVAVPGVPHHEDVQGFVMMEDLGEVDLWAHRLDPAESRLDLYRRTLRQIGRLHAYPLEIFPRRDVPLMEGFDADLYRWERDYFRENFVEGVCRLGLSPQEQAALEEELADLAGRLSEVGQTLVHRDFQSQNVMIQADEPVLIDFQGMRPGNPLYDVGSLLFDPYVSLSPEERMALLGYYYEVRGEKVSWPAFVDAFFDASAQRLMQALGAYGFLGLKKGRTGFLRHIGRGIRNLEEAAGHASRLSLLHRLAERCRALADRGPVPDSP